MLKIADGLTAALLLHGAALHAFVSVLAFPHGGEALVWALSGTLAAALTACINLLRLVRPGDMLIAALALASAVLWAAVALAFGASLGSFTDVRVLWHVIAALGLAGFSVWALLQ